MSASQGNSESSENDNTSNLPSSFNSAPSSRAIGLVAIAVLVGILLLVIVDADNTTNSNASVKAKATTTTTTTTTAQTKNESSTTTASTSTTTPIAGIKKPAEVSVLVLNGSSGPGVASSVSSAISELGYKMLTPGNDSSASKGTIVYYKAGFEKDAKQIASNILPGILTDLKISQPIKTEQFPSVAPTEWDQDNLIGANIVIVVGNA